MGRVDGGRPRQSRVNTEENSKLKGFVPTGSCILVRPPDRPVGAYRPSVQDLQSCHLSPTLLVISTTGMRGGKTCPGTQSLPHGGTLESVKNGRLDTSCFRRLQQLRLTVKPADNFAGSYSLRISFMWPAIHGVKRKRQASTAQGTVHRSPDSPSFQLLPHLEHTPLPS